MPKAARRAGKEPVLHHRDEPSKPYDRHDSAPSMKSHSQPESSSRANRNNHIPNGSPSKPASQPTHTTKSSKRRRGGQKQRRTEEGAALLLVPANEQVSAGVEEASTQAHISHSRPAVNGDLAKAATAHEAVHRRMFGSANGHNHAPPVAPSTPAASGSRNNDAETKALRRQVAEMTKSKEDAEKIAAALQKRIEELEATVASQQAEMKKSQEEIEVKEKLLHDQGSHSESIKDNLHCSVCFDAMDDPHILSCGHCACRQCLQDWFRSPNAYPAPDIEAVAENDDLTYRTKVCHMCREPLFRRPTRMFIVQQMVDLAGLTRDAAPVLPRDTDPWDKVFPPEPKSWLVRDESDNVSRCPQCGCEVDYGECEQCGATFSSTGSDFELSDGEIDIQARIDLGNGLMMDREEELLARQLAAQQDYIDAMANNHWRDVDHRLHGLIEDEAEVDHDIDPYDARLMGMLDDVAEEEEDGDEEEVSTIGIDDEESVIDVDADEEEDNDFEHRGQLRRLFDRHADGDMSPYDDSPEPVEDADDDMPTLRPPRRSARSVSPSEASDGSYESSFIDDDDSDDAMDASGDLTVRRASGERRQRPSLREDSDSSEDDSESEVDEPTIEELRQRRAARYGGAPGRRQPSADAAGSDGGAASPPPAPTSRRRHARARSSSIEVIEEVPAPRSRPTGRRARLIVSDDEE